MTKHTIQIKFEVRSEGNPTEEEMKDFVKELFFGSYSQTRLKSTLYFDKENSNIQLELW